MSEKELIGIGVGCLIGIVVALVAGLAEIQVVMQFQIHMAGFGFRSMA